MIIRDLSKAAIRAAVLLAVAAASLWAIASASATHIAGATYNGAVSGGGSISFNVSGDGSSVTNLTLTGPIEGDTCTLQSAQYTNPTPISGHAFNNGEVSGTFQGVQSAQGNINIVLSTGFGFCKISKSWTATTTAQPPVTAKCKGKPATIFPRPGLARTFNGTNGKDVIVGTSRRDTIRAKGGNDTVCAKGGKDTVRGGGGKDNLYGQGGKDNLVGGGGNDICVGAGGNDTANCEAERSI